MASLSASTVCKFFFFTILSLTSIATVSVSAYEYHVGGAKGWVKPTRNQTETYNDWASKNRIHVGDSIYFKYQSDSVLIVNYNNYKNCNVSNPISEFNDGNTVYQFGRYGFFYFISGEPGHCKSGQKMVIRVMVHPGIEPPASAPSPGSGAAGGGGSSGWPASSSTFKVSVGSYFKTAIWGVGVVIYCLFM